jgi:hypothetical protein
MQTLAQQRCFNHSLREAAARCPQCRQFFCRECITEHDDRVICASCLKQLETTSKTRRRNLAPVARWMFCLLSVLMLWFIFFLIGDSLASIPTSFHEGTLWKTKWIDSK